MKRSLVCLSMLVLATTSFAQESPQPVKPTPQHEWLQKFTGEWTTTGKTEAAPNQPAMECTGTMKSRMLGKLWLVNNIEGHMSGHTFNALQTIGYDSNQKKYVATWIDTVMNHMWKCEGTVDKTGKKLVLLAEGPNYAGKGNSTKYRDTYEFQTKDLVITTSEMMGADGKWVTFMTGSMKRKSPRASLPK